MSICNTDKTFDYSDIQEMFRGSLLNRPVTISLCQGHDGGSKKGTMHLSKDSSLLTPVCGSFSFINPDGGYLKIPLEGSATISGHLHTPITRVTTVIHTQSVLVSGESSQCHRKTP